MEKSIFTFIYFSLLFLCLFSFIKYRLYELNHRSLFQQPLFWAAIAIPLFTCIYLGSFVWIIKLNSFSLTSHGYERFLDMSKLPLLILASAVPLVSIVNNLHRTKQTEKQISEAERKNRVDLYYNHMKFHLDLYKKIESKKISSYYPIEETHKEAVYQHFIKHPQELYRKAYPLSSPDDSQYLNISGSFIIELHKCWVEINARLKQLSESDVQLNPDQELCASKMRIFFGIMNIYEKTCKHLCLGGYHTQKSFILNDKFDKYQIYSPFYDFGTMYQSLQALEEITYAFLDTCRNEEVNLYFPLDDKILIYAEGVVQDWFKYSQFLITAPYQPIKISRLPVPLYV
ncbi:TPA: hypothetical protein NHU23_003799 [Citrobacter freundii]|nr:hypothetical protein [Citrobacter freundii]